MNAGHDDRLEAVTQDLHGLLERRLGDLLGQVQAAQSIARQVQAADDEIRRKVSLHGHLRDAGRAEHAAMVEREVAGLEAIRAEHVDTLARLTSELHG